MCAKCESMAMVLGGMIANVPRTSIPADLLADMVMMLKSGMYIQTQRLLDQGIIDSENGANNIVAAHMIESMVSGLVTDDPEGRDFGTMVVSESAASSIIALAMAEDKDPYEVIQDTIVPLLDHAMNNGRSWDEKKQAVMDSVNGSELARADPKQTVEDLLKSIFEQ